MRSTTAWWLGGLAVVATSIAVIGAGGTPEPEAAPRPSSQTEPPSSPTEAPSGPTPPATSEPGAAEPLRAFAPDSWWNVAVPDDAPTHPDSRAILEYMQTARQNGGGCVTLAGAENSWGQPVYWATAGDTEYDVVVTGEGKPAEVSALRIPDGARAADTNDHAMTVFDVAKGYVVALTDASFDEGERVWTASGATVTYLDSNGLHAGTGRSDDDRNLGSHRGNNGATMMVRYDEFEAGAIRHVLKVASGPETSRRHVFPMIGSDGDSRKGVAPEQGLRFRLKPSLDLDAFDLHPEARVIAEALQTYGFYVGDSAGVTALKLENTRAEGRGQLWTVPANGLCRLPLDPELWDVLPEGYDPT